jgi:hypothetical protein
MARDCTQARGAVRGKRAKKPGETSPAGSFCAGFGTLARLGKATVIPDRPARRRLFSTSKP